MIEAAWMSPRLLLTIKEVFMKPPIGPIPEPANELGLVYLYPRAVLVLLTASGRGVTMPPGVKG